MTKTTGQKIFCVGWHKTGTTTMGEALLQLGYNVVGARLDFAECLMRGDLASLLKEAEKFDAFQDVPWAALYRELDVYFPNSKFILLDRNAEKWLASAVRHFGDRHIEMHEWLYGKGNIVGNEQRYMERYERHLREVKEYFADRSGDLLIFSLEKGDGWEKLCSFLNKPIPKKSFPYANKGKHHYSLLENIYAYLRNKIPLQTRRAILNSLGLKDQRNRFHNYEENQLRSKS